ncbi:MAG: glycosyltransferase family 39 protein [Pseudomonadota bacterium]
MNELHKSRTFTWTLFVAFAITFLWLLDARTLVPPDEGRYAEMAREMFASGDWITTRLNGIKYFEKPPLQTWMNALSFTVFGLGDWQARLWTGLCGLLGVVMTGYAGTRVFGQRAGFYSALVLGSCFYWVLSGQVDSLDMGLSGMTTLALCALLVAQRDEATKREQCWWMLLCWAAMALAVLAKGLIGLVLPGAVLVIYTIAARDWKIWTRLHLAKGLLLFFAIAAPWFVLVGLKNPEQPHFFFIHEHFERFLLKTHHREGAWYYFVGPLMLGMIPWLGLLPQSLLASFKRERSTFQPRMMLLVWAVFIFFFFSYSSSKLPGYILPIFPALALLTGAHIEVASRGSRTLAGALVAGVGVALVILGFEVLKVPHRVAETAMLEAFQPWIIAAGFCALVGGAFGVLHARHLRRDLMVLALALGGFCATELVATGFESYGLQRSGKALVPKIVAELKPDTKIYSVGTYEQSMTFYLKRTVILVDYWDEFTFGLEQQPELSIPTVDAFIGQWSADATRGIDDVAIVSPEILLELKTKGVPMRVVAEDARRTVIANQ